MMEFPEDRSLMELLINRLERISVDSYWAHRASGVRGALIRIMEHKLVDTPIPSSEINKLMNLGFYILERATAGVNYLGYSRPEK